MREPQNPIELPRIFYIVAPRKTGLMAFLVFRRPNLT